MQHCAGFISAESLYRNKTCTVLHQVGVSFDLYYDAQKHKIKIKLICTYDECLIIRVNWVIWIKLSVIVMLNIVDIFNSSITVQHDQARSYICTILVWMKKVHHGTNWLHEFANVYEQPSSLPHYCKGDDIKVLLGFPKSVFDSCCVHTHSWCAWLTSSLIIMDVRSTIFPTLFTICTLTMPSPYTSNCCWFLMWKPWFANWN